MIVFDEKFIKSRPEDVKGVMRAFLDGLAYMKAKPDDAAKIIAKAMGVTPKDVKEQLAGVHHIPLAEMPKAFVKSADTTSYHASGAIIGELLKSKGQIKTLPAAEATFDAQFVNALSRPQKP